MTQQQQQQQQQHIISACSGAKEGLVEETDRRTSALSIPCVVPLSVHKPRFSAIMHFGSR